MSKWIKKGDKVVVIAGNDKGAFGEVMSRKEDRVVVQGINIRSKHAKRRTNTQSSEILKMEKPIHISNVCICDSKGVPLKIKVRSSNKGNKELFYVEDGKEVVYRQLRKTR
jgi:large subunit ribosomal protein L24